MEKLELYEQPDLIVRHGRVEIERKVGSLIMLLFLLSLSLLTTSPNKKNLKYLC